MTEEDRLYWKKVRKESFKNFMEANKKIVGAKVNTQKAKVCKVLKNKLNSIKEKIKLIKEQIKLDLIAQIQKLDDKNIININKYVENKKIITSKINTVKSKVAPVAKNVAVNLKYVFMAIFQMVKATGIELGHLIGPGVGAIVEFVSKLELDKVIIKKIKDRIFKKQEADKDEIVVEDTDEKKPIKEEEPTEIKNENQELVAKLAADRAYVDDLFRAKEEKNEETVRISSENQELIARLAADRAYVDDLYSNQEGETRELSPREKIDQLKMEREMLVNSSGKKRVKVVRHRGIVSAFALIFIALIFLSAYVITLITSLVK